MAVELASRRKSIITSVETARGHFDTRFSVTAKRRNDFALFHLLSTDK